MTALDAERVAASWRRLVAALDGADAEGVPALVGDVLDGLPLIAAAQVPGSDDAPLTLPRVAARLLEAEPSAAWRNAAAQRLLALGHLGTEWPEEDPLLHPHRGRVDPLCLDPDLSFARAAVAVELPNSGLLAVVLARHLASRVRAGEADEPTREWLRPLLADVTAQCLLTSAFASQRINPEHDEIRWLFRRLLAMYEGGRGDGWAAGPLGACCALGLALRRPDEAGALEGFCTQVVAWEGWWDGSAWSVRHPGADVSELKTLLTERVAAFVGAADRQPWSRPALGRLVGDVWPPLLAFGRAVKEFTPPQGRTRAGGPSGPSAG